MPAAAASSAEPVTYDGEDALVDACTAALLEDEKIALQPLLALLGQEGGAAVWASGGKVSLNAVKKALRAAKARLAEADTGI